jgi:uncharacterized membrane protein
MKEKTKVCQISGKHLKQNEAMPAEWIREPILELIRQHYPGFRDDGYVSISELNSFQAKYAEQLLKQDDPILNKSEQEVIQSIESNEVLSRSPSELEEEEPLTFGQRLSDRIAEFGGSWRFIISFALFCVAWMLYNLMKGNSGFDVYPFILLNLVLSCIAALQAPLIMMSQNRKEEKDRQRSVNDYRVNLKAELEIKQLHEKVDLLMIKLFEKNENAETNSSI